MLPIADQTAGPNGLKFFCGHSWVAVLQAKKLEIFFKNILFKFCFTGNARPFS